MAKGPGFDEALTESLRGRAVQLLADASEAGDLTADQLMADEDLTALHGFPPFDELVARLRAGEAAKTNE